MATKKEWIDEIERGKSPNGGWTKKQLELWGVEWPPRKGWRKRLIRSKHKIPLRDGFAPVVVKRKPNNNNHNRVYPDYVKQQSKVVLHRCPIPDCGVLPWELCPYYRQCNPQRNPM